MYVDEDKRLEFCLDPKRVASIARRISTAAKEANNLGIIIFGGSGSGSLRFAGADKQGPGHSEVANLDGAFDGGDGGDIW